ncbi:hydroxyproline-rich glycoprotein family protein [Tasmannia lanceolata]|uniref:hydroxyproline-rich glycoprotein family protein n=1 Tax=Tasmannia lanceolata TaxID=3420 RepID=UPI004062D63C
MAFSFISSPQQQSFFQQQQQPLFQQNNTFFQPQQQQQQQQQIQQQQQPQQQQQMYIFTADKSPASYATKWADLHPDSQKILLQIEERILEYRDESGRLDQCSRLYDSSISNDGFELDANHIVQELGGISTAMEREKILLQELMTVVNEMMRNTEVAVRSFMILRPRFLHSNMATQNVTAPTQNFGAATVSNQTSQLVSNSIIPVYDFYTGIPKRPSPFLEHTVARFEKYLAECRQWIEELEQLLLSDNAENSSSSDLSLLQSLPKVMSNVHDFFVHVAAKVESLHQYIESMKTAYLADQRRRGDGNDPFLEADRRETAKQEAAARRVHPTLHLPAISQPSTQVAGLFASSATPATSSVPQPSVGPSPAMSGSGFSLFGTPQSALSASTASSFLFSTPTSSTQSSTLFGTSAFSPQSSLFGSASTSLFGSTQTPSSFGASTQAFASTPAIGSSPLFSTPSFVSGAATGSGASFGPVSKSAKPKSRTSRR